MLLRHTWMRSRCVSALGFTTFECNDVQLLFLRARRSAWMSLPLDQEVCGSGIVIACSLKRSRTCDGASLQNFDAVGENMQYLLTISWLTWVETKFGKLYIYIYIYICDF